METVTAAIATEERAGSTITIIGIASPLAPRELAESPHVFLPFGLGLSILDILGMNGIRGDVRARVTLSLPDGSDEVLQPEDWHRIFPPADAILTIRLVAQDPISLGVLISSISAAAISAATSAAAAGAAVAGAVAAGTASVAAAIGISTAQLVMGVVSLVGAVLQYALISPPSAPASHNESSPRSYTISGLQNVEAPYAPYPFVGGKRHVAPIVVGGTFTEFLGKKKQFLRGLLSNGYGQLAQTDFRIGDTAITDFSEVDLEVRPGALTDPPITLYTKDPNEVTLNAVLLDSGNVNGMGFPILLPWQTRGTLADTDEISVDATAASGLYDIDSGGHRRTVYLRMQARFAPTGTAHGVAPPGETFGDDNWTYVIPLDPVNLNDPHYQLSATSIFWKFAGASMSSLATGVAWNVDRGQYDVQMRVSRISWDTGDVGDTIQGTVYWTAIRSFRHVDPFTLPGMSKIAIRIRADHQLSGEIKQINCLASSVLPDWDSGTQTWITRETANPASIYRAILQGRANKQPVTDDEIDLAALQRWHEYCDAHGFSFNGIFDNRITNPEARRQVASIGRASPGFSHDLKYSIVIDEPQTTVVRYFTPRNSWGFEVQKPFLNLPQFLTVQFANSDADDRTDVLAVYDDGYSADGAGGTAIPDRPPETLDLSKGVTSALLAWQLARYHLAQGRLRPRVITFYADAESFVVERGDLVGVAHDVIRQGLAWGRIKQVSLDANGNAIAVTLDEELDGDGVSAYALRLQKNNGYSAILALHTFNGASKSVAFAAPIAAGTTVNLKGETISTLPEEDDLVTFGLAGQTDGQFLVTRIERAGGHGADLCAMLTVVDYAPAVYLADANPPLGFPATGLTTRIALAAPIVESTRSDNFAANRSADGSINPRVILGLAPAAIASQPAA